MNSVKKRRRAVVDPSACVACGCCVKVCPLQAIEIVRGVMAQVRQDKCVGCGRCTHRCPELISISATVNKVNAAVNEIKAGLAQQ